MGDTNGLGFELASIAAMEHEQRDRLGRQAMGAIRSIATIIGCPANTDPLTDLDGLVSMARGMAERVVGVEARIADAVAAERYAAGAWIRSRPDARPIWAQCIEHGDHIDNDAPPLPSLRMVMLARDELLRQVETLTSERDQLEARVRELIDLARQRNERHAERVDALIAARDAEFKRLIGPVEHAREVLGAFEAGVLDDIEPEAPTPNLRQMLRSYARDSGLLDRVGADVLAAVEGEP